ncbi:hypothetical protein ACFODZ_07575 [Marinicella sediminis]|uniref:ABC-type uncharacterized transport system domain-containing protein n=1 Tax=Marinicella sediminis TaxID=1792834 RepID=A0ABV7JBQ6_9GAMM|nr:hypothetical protein [Marinicella sediminis]
MKQGLMIIGWLLLVMLSARLIDNFRMVDTYTDLLPQSAKNILHQQQGLTIEVYAQPESPAAQLVNNFLQPIVASVENAEVKYMDIDSQPQLKKKLGIEKLGEMLIYQGTEKFHLTTLSYEAFFNGLKRLSHQDGAWLVFLEGHQGKSFDAGVSLGYGQWLKALQAANYQVMVLPWSAQLKLPEKTRLLVLPAPARPFNLQQRLWLEQQVQQGISLLWLTDPMVTSVQPELSLLFDVVQTDAFHQGHLIIKSFPDHPVNQAFDRPLDLVEVMPYETANDVLWVNDQQQALASTSQLGASRLMVVGDSDFLADEHLFSGGNLEMSFRLIDWLLKRDERIDLPAIGRWQSELYFAANEVLWLAGLMLIVVPLLLLLGGLLVWFKFKRER